MIICKNFDKGQEIKCLEDWLELCPPAGKEIQWKNGRSAKELARDWTMNKGSNLLKILNKTFAFDNITLLEAAPEYVSKFDDFKGNGRQHDLLAIGWDNKGKVLLSIEAKADEEFGEIISKEYLNAVTKRINRNNTKVPERIEKLIYNVFGDYNKASVFDLRYQLLHGVAGVLSEAKKQDIKRAVFIINTYQSEDEKIFNIEKYKKNQKDLENFLNYLSKGKIQKCIENALMGPFKFRASKYIVEETDLYILQTKVTVK